MHIASSTYTAPLDEVDRHREAHLAWIAGHVEDGSVLAAGRRTPPTGGVILLAAMEPERAATFFDEDPYVLAGVASYEVIATFRPGVRAPGLEGLS
ncbi:MAG TPA: YciI family protein [Solirubrobacteraceae bacterium]